MIAQPTQREKFWGWESIATEKRNENESRGCEISDMI